MSSTSTNTSIELTTPDDYHTHLRDGDVLEHTVIAVWIHIYKYNNIV